MPSVPDLKPLPYPSILPSLRILAGVASPLWAAAFTGDLDALEQALGAEVDRREVDEILATLGVPGKGYDSHRYRDARVVLEAHRRAQELDVALALASTGAEVSGAGQRL